MRDHLLSIASSLGGPILGFDTSSATASLCLINPATQAVRESTLTAEAMPSESVVAAIASELEAENLRPQDLKVIVVGIGPGSFTGVRVGLATAKGLAWGASVPLVGVSSLALIAANAAKTSGHVAVALNARREHVFGAVYAIDAARRAHPVVQDALFAPADFLKTIEPYRPTVLVSDVMLSQETESLVVPKVAYGFLAVESRLRRGDWDPVEGLVPNYLRVSEAERKLGGDHSA